MNTDRLQKIIDSYGANTNRWPEHERTEAIDLLNASSEASELLMQARAIDTALDSFQVEPVNQALNSKILRHALKENTFEKLTAWLMPDLDNVISSIWRPALAAAMSMTLGIAIGMALPEESTETLSDSEELYLLAITAESSEGWNYDSNYE